MVHIDSRRQPHKESGNVLFLILVAVILFAALSYAVTQSTQTGTKGVDDDSAVISAAQIVQYPAGLRTSLIRMIISGTTIDELQFNAPENFAALTSIRVGVFHPDGGGAVYQDGPRSVMDADVAGKWHYNAEFEIENIGVQVTSALAGNEIVAFLPGLRAGVCGRLNREAGISGIPDLTSDVSAAYTKNMDDQYALPSGEIILGALGSNGSDDLTGQPFGCFQNNGGDYVYYHVLAER